MRTKHLVAILVLLTLAVPASPAYAGGIVTVCDEAHLLAALAGGGTVFFTCSGTITLTATIVITTDTSIDGSGQNVTISGNNTVRVFAVNEGATLRLNRLTVADGKAGNGAGGGTFNSGTLTVNNSTFSGNIAYYEGGGIFNSAGTVTVSNSTFSGNSADSNGGGIDNWGTLTVSNSLFSGNNAGLGGAILNGDQSTLKVNASTFSGNMASYGGGGIYNARSYSDFGAVNVSHSTFVGNSAAEGGGIDNRGTLTVNNSTFSGNSADYGGGIYDSWILTVTNSTFSSNGADYGGGGIYESIRWATLKNTIVANNRPGGNCYGAITDGGGNLSYPGTACPGINGDPLLGPLQDNGGLTETMALGPGSAAIDAGIDAICAAPPVNNLDQRGVTRPLGSHCDIGAVEQPPYLKTWLPVVHSQ